MAVACAMYHLLSYYSYAFLGNQKVCGQLDIIQLLSAHLAIPSGRQTVRVFFIHSFTRLSDGKNTFISGYETLIIPKVNIACNCWKI